MQIKPLMTHDIGSLDKPAWRVKALADTPLTESDLQDAEKWGKRLDIKDYPELLQILSKLNHFSPQEKERILHFSSLYGIRLLEKAGLDIVWDGEQHRVEMYEYPVRRMTGFAFRGHVRSFDNKYYRKASCIEQPHCPKPYHVEEYEAIKALTSHPIKIPITGAYTLVDWSFDEHYVASIIPGMEHIREERKKARRQFLLDTAKGILYPNIKALQEKGAFFLQLDEPAATTKRDEIPEFVLAIKNSIGDLAGKAFFSVHVCFSDYGLLFPDLLELEGIVNEVHLEYANRDTKELGTTAEKRTGYAILEQLKETKFHIGIGVLDVHTDFIESPQLIRDRILYACDIIQDPKRILIAPDCGLRTRSWDVAFQKLSNMNQGRRLALEILG